MRNTNLYIGKTNEIKTKKLFKDVKNMIENDENIFFYDNNANFYKTFMNELTEKGYNTYLLNLDDTTKSYYYNPLTFPYKLYKSGNKDKAYELIKIIANEICFEEKSNGDPFWENMSSDYLTGLIYTLFEYGEENTINFGSLQIMLTTGEEKVEDSTVIKKFLDKIDPLNPIYIALSSTVYAPRETRGSIISVLKQKLNNYCMRENLLNVINHDGISIENMEDSKTAIFVIGSNTKIGNILLEMLMNKKKKFNYILDEFNTITKISELNKYLNNIENYNAKMFIATRILDEALKLYGKNFEQIFENVEYLDEDTKLVVGDYDTYPITEIKKSEYFNLKEHV